MELILFLIGISIGSFLNVVIYRTEKEISIISPPSFCPFCKSKINWYDNIPLLSYIILGGRCRSCGNNISIQYPVVELLAGITTLINYKIFGGNNFWWFVLFSLISYMLIIISVVDFKTMMLSDLYSYIVAFLGFISSKFNPLFEGNLYSRLTQSITGIIAGAGTIYILMVLGKKIFKKDSVGEGDIFLFVSIGSFLGVSVIIDALILASFLGAFYGLTLIFLKKIERFSYIPFGPFLTLGSYFKVLFNIKVFSILD